ncbi:MAG TPA: hypothetical protein VGC67_02190 [Cellulomonas sp.]
MDVVTSAVNPDGTVWFELEDFTSTPSTTHTVTLVRGSTSYGSTTVITDASGDTALADSWIRVSASAPEATDYHLVVTNPLTPGTDDVTSAAVTIDDTLTQVTNPGDHAGGDESIVVHQGGVWTFNAEGFDTTDGQLTATVAGSSTQLSGVGQVDGTTYWELDATGATTPLTRVKIPSGTATGTLDLVFSDGTTSVTRTLVIDAATTATATIVSTEDTPADEVWVSGTGWTTDIVGYRGSAVAVKIDDGAYSRISGYPATWYENGDPQTVANLTVWAVLVADANGDFADASYVDDFGDTVYYSVISLPDGTTAGENGSSPAFSGTGHTLRLLSGNVGGDPSRTLLASGTF